jgi:hypothetical protein
MRAIILSTAFLLSFFCMQLRAQTTYYSNNTSTNFNTLTGWSLNADGTGANPATINNTVRLIVQNGHSKTTSTIATVNQLTIQSGGTVTASNAITVNGTGLAFNINNGGTYIHNNTGTLSSTIFAGTETFGASSTFQINNWQSTAIDLISSLTASVTGFDANTYYYGNLIINWAAGGLWEQGWSGVIRLTAGNFQFASGFTGEFLLTPNSGQPQQVSLYVGGNFSMNSTATINFTDFGDPSYMFVNGNVTQTAGTLHTTGSGNGSAGNIYTYGTGSADWTFTGGTRKLIGYRINGTKTVNIKSNFHLGQISDLGWGFTVILYVEANAVLDVETYTITCSYSTQLATAGKIRTANTNGLVGSTTTALSNLPTVQWGIVANCTAEYYATGAQTVSAVPIYENVTIMNSGTKLLAGDATVFKVFNFTGTGNYLNLNANNLTITNTGSISNSSATSYFISNPTTGTNGRLRQNGLAAAAKVFPIGTATNYLPVTITPSATGSDFSINVFRSTTTDGTPTGPAYAYRGAQCDAVYWIDRVTGTGVNAEIRFDWQTDAIEGTAFRLLNSTPGNQIGIWRRVAGSWVLANGGATNNYISNNTTNFVYTAGSLPAFGTAGIGYPYIISNIATLPFNFNQVYVSKTNSGGALVEWKLNMEENADYYEVEKSSDGRVFDRIASVPANGSGNYKHDDAYLFEGANYYRIKAIDKQGSAAYSSIAAVNYKSPSKLQLFNNPAVSQLGIKHPASINAQYRITDMSGRILLNGRIVANAVITQIDITKLPSGSYVIYFVNDNEHMNTFFIKQ